MEKPLSVFDWARMCFTTYELNFFLSLLFITFDILSFYYKAILSLSGFAGCSVLSLTLFFL